MHAVSLFSPVCLSGSVQRQQCQKWCALIRLDMANLLIQQLALLVLSVLLGSGWALQEGMG